MDFKKKPPLHTTVQYFEGKQERCRSLDDIPSGAAIEAFPQAS
jgi:hypothetical protein